MGEGTVFSLFVSSHLDGGGGGYPIKPWTGRGGPRSILGWGGTPSQVQVGGVPEPALDGGVPNPSLDRGVPPSQVQVGGGPQSQVWGEGFPVWGPGGYLVSVKGKIFDTRFGLIHVQTGKKKIFVEGPSPPPVKGKFFWHQIWLDTCSDWEKHFLSRDPPPPPLNSKDLLWLRGGRYTSCVHA